MSAGQTEHAGIQWPEVERQMRPWTRWWWLGNAVDKPNLTRLLEEYRRAGLGGVEITPIYGVKDQEARDIAYLSPEWVAMLRHTLDEAARLDMGVDMVTGTGWPFGGPHVSDADAEDKLVIEKTSLAGGQPITWTTGGMQLQALAAFSERGEAVSLLDQIGPDGRLAWTPPAGAWTLYAVSQKWAGRLVKRAAPGGEGKCINPFSRTSLLHYLERFDAVLTTLPHGALRCHFHDSFEYLADWSPTVFVEFQARRGYDLRGHLPALAGDGDPDTVARVKTDYRETISEMLRENFSETWARWSHNKGSLSRNQAHGSPGNLLDLYGTADIPETEIFGGAGDPRANKFASSAAHVLGKPLVSSESCTWLGEHFTVSLAQCKLALDRLLAAGINHIFYHGTPYSPADAAWPGWLFYASTTFAPQDPLWHDLPTLNTYITRCQSVLQSGSPDHDVLLYWPLHDLWQNRPDAFMLEINGTWLTEQPIGRTAQTLWDRGYSYDYVSDHQLTLAQAEGGGIRMPGGHYSVVVVPPCRFLPLPTLRALVSLAEGGATIVFQDQLPSDVPGLGALANRRQSFQDLLSRLEFSGAGPGVQEAPVGNGRVFVGADLEAVLAKTRVRRESLADHKGIVFVRRELPDGHYYFLANQSDGPLDGWVGLASPLGSAVLLDPMTGCTGVAQVHGGKVFLHLPAGASIILRTFTAPEVDGPAWRYVRPSGEPVPLTGAWTVAFKEGGPALPPPYEADALTSWTQQGDTEATERFSGTARYTLRFDAPPVEADEWWLELGRVCESARVHFNGAHAGSLIARPFRVRLGTLRDRDNVLEVEVTNLAANRIRDMDRRQVPWRIFREINFVDIHYKPFNASEWPLHESGLLGPVCLVPMQVLTVATA